MKPSFALNFAEDRIDLLHRASGGWLEVGTVPLDEPDLGAALNYLRGSALGLEPRGITTKLVIPNSQILYTSILAPGPDAASRRAQIRSGLEGRTPYGVDDLVFDWSGTGATIQVAVVARETLDEAEAFARDHRFNPVSFVAIPPAGQFGSEPWFGPTTAAETILARDEKVERDQDPIKIVMRTPPAPEPVAPDHLKVAEDIEPGPDAAPEDLAASAPAPTGANEDAAEAALRVALEGPPVPKNAAAEIAPAIAVSSPVIPADDAGPNLAEDQNGPADAAVPVPRQMNGKTPGAQGRPAGRAAGRPAETPLAFASRRAAQAAPGDDDAASPKEAAQPEMTARRAVPEISGMQAGKVTHGIEVPGAAAARVTAPAIALPKDRRFPQAWPVGKDAHRPREAPAGSKLPEAGDVAGIGGRRQPQRGKPRFLGLILTGILLALLVLVAAWSSIYVASYLDEDAPAVAASEATDGAIDPVSGEPLLQPTPDDEMAADLQDPEAFPDPEAEIQPIPDTADELAAQKPAVEALPVSPVEAPATLAEGTPNPTNEPQDEIFLAEIEPTPETEDAIAISEPIAPPDPLPPAQVTPPPFGTLYTFDAEGLIVPTPDGIITPEGVRLVAGRPARVPPERPEALSDAASAAAAPDAPTVTDEPVFAADPALAGARPRLRPENLSLPETADDDGAALTAEATTRVSGLRPKARPASTLAATEPADTADQAALDAAVQAASASIVAGAETSVTGSPLAVLVSRKPAPRPALPDKAVADAVEAAVAAASAPAEPEPEPKPAAEPTLALAPQPEEPAADGEAIDEPEVTSASPDIPTRASVAKQATFKNAFNLSKTNLIGVYGTSANRYAMVRQSNGRFVKVEVGDRLDGGKVAAISEREVKYVKNGKTLTLTMPKG